MMEGFLYKVGKCYLVEYQSFRCFTISRSYVRYLEPALEILSAVMRKLEFSIRNAGRPQRLRTTIRNGPHVIVF